MLTEEDKQHMVDYLTEHTPPGAGIVVVIITSEGSSTFTNLSMPDPKESQNET